MQGKTGSDHYGLGITLDLVNYRVKQELAKIKNWDNFCTLMAEGQIKNVLEWSNTIFARYKKNT